MTVVQPRLQPVNIPRVCPAPVAPGGWRKPEEGFLLTLAPLAGDSLDPCLLCNVTNLHP